MKFIKFRNKAGRRGTLAARKMIGPIASLSCLYNKFSWLHVDGLGFIDPVCQYLKIKNSTSWTARQKLTHLCFDEMKIKNVGDIDRILDSVLGPADQAHILMARGIADNWKWEVFLAFDYQIVAADIMMIICHLEGECGLEIISVSSDQGGKNIGLNGELEITAENLTFPHPFDDERRVYFFHDFGHEFKNLRNHLMDDKCQLPDGSRVSKKDFQDLQNICDTEITCGFHIEDILLDCTSSDRQQTRYAIRLLSDLTAANFYRFFPDSPSKCALAKFIALVAKVYKIMSSRAIYVKGDKWKDGLSVHPEEQTAAIEELIVYLQNTTFAANKFQKAMIITLKATLSLQKFMAEKHGVPYLLTSRLLQDALESYNDVIR